MSKFFDMMKGLIAENEQNVATQLKVAEKATTQAELDSAYKSAQTSFNRNAIKNKYLSKPELQGALPHVIRDEEVARKLYSHQDKKASYTAQVLVTQRIDAYTETRTMLPVIFGGIESEGQVYGHRVYLQTLPKRLQVNPFRSYLTTLAKAGYLKQVFAGRKTDYFEVVNDPRNLSLWRITRKCIQESA